jgi:N-acetylglucosaminyldiphosphoundecaprenol N-acetyl-beta-D-mannosaminyltransferase
MSSTLTIPIPEKGEVDIPNFRVLGVRVHAVQIPDAVRILEHWIRERSAVHYVCPTGMHGVSETLKAPELRDILNAADLITTDGTPLVWLARKNGYAYMKRRVYGPELMGTFMKETGSKYKHFFYGNRASAEMAEVSAKKWGTRCVGIYPPPPDGVWPLPPDEKKKLIQAIESSQADVVWCGLGAPRQEKWMYEFRHHLTAPVLIGVGAAFDFHVGKLQQAPVWMQENGLEWFFRLSHEPKRLWRRYLVNGPKFAWNVGLELAHLKKFS